MNENKKAPPIVMVVRVNSKLEVKEFTDWWNFADWAKFHNLGGTEVTVVHWEYAK